MALTGQIGSATAAALVGTGSGAGRGSSFSSAIAAQFTAQQASLVLARPSASDRVFLFQQSQATALSLQRETRKLLGLNSNSSPLFSLDREVVVADPTVAKGFATALATDRTFSLQVDQVAAGQDVRSDTLDADANHTLGSDNDARFRINVDGQDYNLSIDLNQQTTNQDVLEAVRDEFNSVTASSGVRAEIVDEGSGDIALRVVTQGTGATETFTVTDRGSDDLLAQLNLEESQSADPIAGTGGLLVSAADAQFSIDGGPTLTSSINTIKLFADTVELTLTGTSGGAATTVTVQAESGSVSESVQDFVSAFNEALSFVESNPSSLTTPLSLRLGAALARTLPALEQIGISRGSDGLLSVDTTELEAAISDGRFAKVSNALVGTGGLALAAHSATSSFLAEPARFLTEATDTGVRPAALAAVQRAESRGLLLDLLV